MANNITVKDASLATQTMKTTETGGVHASHVNVDNTVPVSGPLTDTQLRATAVPVSGTFYQATQPVSIASPVPITDNSGSLTVDGTVAISGTVAVTDNSGSLTVDGTVAVSSLPAIPAGTNNIGDVDVLTLPALPAGTNNIGDVDILSIAAGDNNIGNVDVVTLPGVAGTVAHDSADSGNPVKVGGRARSSEITAVANDDITDFVADLTGKQIVLPYANPENFVSGAITTAMTGTTSTSLVAAPGAGLRNYITTIIVSNSHATVGTDVVIQDGSGGTTLLTIPAAAVYGGAVIQLPTPLRQPTTNTALYCANVTTGASTKVSAVGYKGA